MSAKQEAQDWAEGVRRYGRRTGRTYAGGGGLTPTSGGRRSAPASCIEAQVAMTASILSRSRL